MLDQSFSVENFRKIFDLENRKGNYLEGTFFPSLEEITFEIKKSISDIRTLRQNKSSYSPQDYFNKKKNLYEIRDALKNTKEERLLQLLEIVSKKVYAKGFSFDVTQIDLGFDKPFYREARNAEAYFSLKQLQSNIRNLYKVKQSNRFHIVSQLKQHLNDKFPKYVIRTDISSFYESIPRDEILKFLNEDPLLSQTSKKFIKKILYEYGTISGEQTGLPRGIGISAYLAELYMRKLDQSIQGIKCVKYYARYVDDIFIISYPDPNDDVNDIKSSIFQLISDNFLTPNSSKTKDVIIDKSTQSSIEYLGYKFEINGGQVQLKLTDSKIEKLKNRIDLTFADYNKNKLKNSKKASSLLLKRLRFLTGNTRLHNNKRNVVTGIFFSNSLLSKPEYLLSLDSYLNTKIPTINNQRIEAKISQLSFVDGFERRRYFQFSPTDLRDIVKVWKHVT